MIHDPFKVLRNDHVTCLMAAKIPEVQKWVVSENPFTQTRDNEFMYICFNDVCPYFVKGWDFM